jgi:hypothetical protein
VTQLLSKLLAGGLSASVILIWWPRFFPDDNVETWLIRGVVWTLMFELLLHSVAPLEQALWRSPAARTVRSRIAGSMPQRGGRLRGVAAGTAVVVPLALLATAPAPPAKKPPRTAEVKRVTEIKRVVHVDGPVKTVPAADDPSTRPEAPVAPAQPATPVHTATPVAQRHETTRSHRSAPQTTSTPVKQDSPAPTRADTPQAAPETATPQQDSSGTVGSTAMPRFAG